MQLASFQYSVFIVRDTEIYFWQRYYSCRHYERNAASL